MTPEQQRMITEVKKWCRKRKGCTCDPTITVIGICDEPGSEGHTDLRVSHTDLCAFVQSQPQIRTAN